MLSQPLSLVVQGAKVIVVCRSQACVRAGRFVARLPSSHISFQNQESTTIDFDYLHKGLCALARAHRANTMAGHLGAAVIAGYFFGEEHAELDDKVQRAIERDLDHVIGGEESLWFSDKKAGITVAELFEPFPEEEPNEKLIAGIAEGLAINIDKTRQSGHNVIFASIAIRALHDHPEYATPSIVAGIRKLIVGSNAEGPGRGYYGKERGWIEGVKVSLPADNPLPVCKNEQAMAMAVIDDLIESGAVRRQGFGGHFHIINRATALTELTKFGYRDLAKQGLAAHHHHSRLYRSLADVEAELGKLNRAAHDPRTPEYWATDAESQWSAHNFDAFVPISKVSGSRHHSPPEPEYRRRMDDSA